MTDEEIRQSCLELAAMRNQKLSATAGDIIAEAAMYEAFVKNGLTKSKQAAKS